jgi:lipopolysaccharide assembly outer membrane protein LptD (OstA)
MEYVVKAETRDGKIAVLKRGFASKEEAEDQPIWMLDWKRVWTEAVHSLDASAID